MTYRAVTRTRDVVCERYSLGEHGVELYGVSGRVSSTRRPDDDEAFLAFVPYENLLTLLNEDVPQHPDRSIV
jgi:hypothetical protein